MLEQGSNRRQKVLYAYENFCAMQSYSFFSHLRTYLLILEKGWEREKEILMRKRNVNWLLPICALNFGVQHDTPTTAPPGQGKVIHLFF